MRFIDRRALAGWALALAGSAVFASTAVAVTDTIAAQAGNVFAGGTGPGGAFSVDAGSVPQFLNSDDGPEAEPHNVVASDQGPDDEELFRTPLLSGGVTAPLTGAQYLSPGSYRFICTIHSGMEGSLSVSGPGAVPRPAIDVAVASSKLAKVRKGKLEVTVKATTPSENVSLTARLGSKPLASASGIDLAMGESRRLMLKLDRKARKLLEGLAKARVSLSAEVPFGAPDSAKRTLG